MDDDYEEETYEQVKGMPPGSYRFEKTGDEIFDYDNLVIDGDVPKDATIYVGGESVYVSGSVYGKIKSIRGNVEVGGDVRNGGVIETTHGGIVVKGDIDGGIVGSIQDNVIAGNIRGNSDVYARKELHAKVIFPPARVACVGIIKADLVHKDAEVDVGIGATVDREAGLQAKILTPPSDDELMPTRLRIGRRGWDVHEGDAQVASGTQPQQGPGFKAGDSGARPDVCGAASTKERMERLGIRVVGQGDEPSK